MRKNTIKVDRSPETIQKLFKKISYKYDLFNDLMSGFGHRRTRVFALKLTDLTSKQAFLDLATGTGDFAFLIREKTINGARIVGIDLSADMLTMAKSKLEQQRIDFLRGDATQLPFPGETFDCLTISYGLRNIEKPQKALKEFFRVTKRHGTLLIVEMTPPVKSLNRLLTHFYFSRIVPLLAKLILSTPEVYRYMSQSVAHFFPAPTIVKMMQEGGWQKIRYFSMFLGGISVLQGVKL